MKIALDIDEAALRRAAHGLSASPTLLKDLATDPQKVLSKIGITVDDETAALVLHFDT
jgi:hypothetical protein